MQTAYGARSYVQTQTTAATPLELVVMLYEAGLRAADASHDAWVRRLRGAASDQHDREREDSTGAKR